MINRLTGSRLDLAKQCPGSHALAWADSVSEYSEKGTERHRTLERIFNGDLHNFATPKDDPWYANLRHLSWLAREIFEGLPTKAEVPFAWLPGRDRSQKLTVAKRDYTHAPIDWICLTIDAIGIGDDRLIVVDWKTGWADVAHPRDSLQIKAAALLASRWYLRTNIRAHIVHLPEVGAPEIHTAEFDALALDEIAYELELLVKTVKAQQVRAEQGLPLTLRTGSHCRGCPALHNCPAISGTSQALVQLSEKKPALTPEIAGDSWAKLRAVEALCVRVRESLETYLDANGEFPLPNGGKVRRVQSEKVEIDPLLAREVLAQLVGPLAAEQAIHTTTSRTAINTALRANGMRNTGDVIKQIEARGGVRRYERWKVQELRP